MDVPPDQSTPTGASPAHLTLRGAVWSPRRRRPTGAPPPLPHHLQTSGVGWLVAAVLLVGLALVVFGRGLRGAAVAVTVADDAVVRWLGGLHAPGLEVLWQGLAHGGSWWTLTALESGVLLALLVLRRWRHLLVWLVAWPLVNGLTYGLMATTARRPRPFGADLRTSWGGWALPAAAVTVFAAVLVAILYTLVPQGRWRNMGKWVAAVLVALVISADSAPPEFSLYMRLDGQRRREPRQRVAVRAAVAVLAVADHEARFRGQLERAQRRVAGKKYFFVETPEFMDVKPAVKIVEEALAGKAR